MSDASSQQSDTPERGKSVRGDRALDSLVFRSRTTGKEAAARSRLVRRLRIILPIAAVLMVVLFIINTQSNSVDQAYLEDFKTIAESTEDLRMANPRFAGIDDEGKPFEITADAASQNPSLKDVIELQNPRAVQGQDETASVVTATNGLYRSDTNILELKDDVTLEHELGRAIYVLKSPTATVLIKDQVVTSDTGVGAVGPDGAALKADKMTAYRSDGRVIFEGNVSMRIYPGSDKPPIPVLRDSQTDTEDSEETETEETKDTEPE